MSDKLPDHISHTQAQLWLRCQRQYFYRYLQGVIIPPSGALVIGGSTHRATEHYCRQRALTGQTEPKDVVLDVYDHNFRKQAPEALWDTEKPAQAKDRGYHALAKYYDEQLTLVTPASEEDVERRVYLDIGAGVNVLMYLDVRDVEGRVIEFKTTKSKPSELPADTRLQLWLYQHALRKVYPELLVAESQAHYIVSNPRNPTKPQVELFPTPDPDQQEMGWWLRILIQIRKQMEAALRSGDFLPAAQGGWVCSEKWCGYRDLCQKDF